VRRVGAVLEASSFHPGRSGRNHLRTLAAASGMPAARADEVLELVELGRDGRRRVRGYSLGMRQRLALAAALLGDPQVLVLDEPANGLDPQGIRWLRDFLRARAAKGNTVLVSSHVLAEVELMADHVVILHHGRLVTQSPVRELAGRTSGRVLVRSPQAEDLARALADAGLRAAAGADGALEVPGATTERVGELAAAQGIVLHELRREGPSLEQIFLELTGDGP
jgi:ABC-2 type transport system ATP-binding protein